jgi:hypothetical protein
MAVLSLVLRLDLWKVERTQPELEQVLPRAGTKNHNPVPVPVREIDHQSPRIHFQIHLERPPFAFLLRSRC